MERALALRLKMSPSHLDEHNHLVLYHCCTPTGRFWPASLAGCDPFCEGVLSDFAAYGSATSVYFKFLKLLTWVFVLVTVCAVPQLVINVNGNGRLTSLNAITLSSTTLGNLGLPLAASNASSLSSGNGSSSALSSVAGLTVLDIPGWSLVAPKGLAPTPTVISLVYSGCDLVGVVLLFCAYLWLRVSEEQEEEEVNQATITAEDYTVFIPNLPEFATEESLREHFTAFVSTQAPRPANHPPDFAAVEEVHVVECDHVLNKMFEDRGRLRRQAERKTEERNQLREDISQGASAEGLTGLCFPLHRQLAALDRDIKSLDARITSLSLKAAQYSKSHETSPVAAFVTFRHQEAKNFVVRAYRGGFIAWCCQSASHRLAHKGSSRSSELCCPSHLHVRSAPAPSAVLWGNLQITQCQHAVCVGYTSIAALVLICLSFTVLYFSSHWTASLERQGALAVCPVVSPPPLLPGSPQLAALHAVGSALNATKFCACESMPWGSKTLSQLSAPFAATQQLDASDCPFQACPRWLQLDYAGVLKQGFCVEWIKNRSTQGGLVGAAAVITLAINTLLAWVMRYLTTMEGHYSWEDLNSSLAMRLFIASFFNTGLLVVLLNVAWPLVLTREGFPTGKYEDFTPAWFNNVGTSILTTMLINTFTVHLFTTVSGCKHCCDVQRGAFSARTQRDLNNKVLGPFSDPAIRYGQLFNILFVCYVFSTGMPILVPIACASFFLYYWVDKLAFMWYYRSPPAFSIHLQDAMSSFIPLALLLHCALGTWMLSASELFKAVDEPALARYSAPVVAQMLRLSTYPTLSQGISRVTQPGVLPLFLATVALAAYIALSSAFFVLRQASGAAFSLLTCGHFHAGGRRRAWDLSTPTYRQALQPPAAMVGLPSYNMLLDPGTQYNYGYSEEWARSHKRECLGRQERARAPLC